MNNDPPLGPFQRHPTSAPHEAIRTIPQLIDYNAEHNPRHLFCQQVDGNFNISVSNLELKHAILQCQKWLRSRVAPQMPMIIDDAMTKGCPIALLMDSDVGLFLHQMALMALGVPVLLLSPRLSATSIRSLLRSTSASAIVASEKQEQAARAAGDGLLVHAACPFTDYFPPKIVPGTTSICHPHSYIDDSDRNVLILHSSGTTGLPKAIYQSHRYLYSFSHCHQLDHDGLLAQGLNVSTLPLYHGYGLLPPILALSIGRTVCYPAASDIPSPRKMLIFLKSQKASSFMTVPSILEDISAMSDQDLAPLAELDFVAFGGGGLNPAAGDRLRSLGVKLVNHYGTTESGPLSSIFIPSGDYNWRFFRLRVDVDLQMQETDKVNDERRFKLTTFPPGWDKPFEIQDQLVCNPDHPSTDFNVVGRNDDTIVLSTGENVQPQILEGDLCASSLVKSAVAFGEHQREIGLLVQPAQDIPSAKYAEFKEQIWPLVQQANEKMDDHGRIYSTDTILVIPSSVELPRTDKGSVARQQVYWKFQDEIIQLYAGLESVGSAHPLRQESLRKDIQSIISKCLNWPPNWPFTANLLEMGITSLQATRVRRALAVAASRSLHILPSRITSGFVYANPSVSDIAKALDADCILAKKESRTHSMDELVKEFLLPPIPPADPRVATVLMTGATGSLGAHCLASLLALPNVKKIFCLVRHNNHWNASDRVHAALEQKRLQVGKDSWARVEVFECDTAKNKWLGLSQGDYKRMRVNLTHILHVAWPVDFNLPLSSLSSQFATLHNLLLLCRGIHSHPPRIIPRFRFISSIATVGHSPRVNFNPGIVPETFASAQCVNALGYAEGKSVCERIIQDTRRRFSDEMDVGVIRMGQVSGSTETGFWNATEHIPALIRSSQLIKALPRLSGTFSWIPVDNAAASVAEALVSPKSYAVCHIENPIRQSWYDMIELLGAELNIPGRLDWEDWLEAVANAADDGNPAKELYDFFHNDFVRMACGEVILGTDLAKRGSVTLRNVTVISTMNVRKCLQYWKDVGALV